MAKKHVLSIWMNGDRVASWSRHKLDHELVYEPDWVLSPQGRPLSLSLPFIPGNQPHRGDRVRWFFENLLPDRADVRNRLRDRFHAASAQAFDLLAEIGRDCIGAIQVLADDADIPAIKEIKGEALSEAAIARSLVGHGFYPPLGLHHDSQLNAFNLADDLLEPYRPFVDFECR